MTSSFFVIEVETTGMGFFWICRSLEVEGIYTWCALFGEQEKGMERSYVNEEKSSNGEVERGNSS
jgi:hypothetical protein